MTKTSTIENDRGEPSLSEEILIDALAAVLDRNSAIYVAGPLATGLEYYNRFANGERNINVRPQNERYMREAVDILRRQHLLVIDPSTIVISGWSSTRIGDLYIKIMAHFAREIRMMPGWEYSSGATKECIFAAKYGKDILDLNGNMIGIQDALSAIKAAAKKLDDLGISEHKLHLRWEALIDMNSAN